MRVPVLADHVPYRFTSFRAHCWDIGKGRIARDGTFSHIVTQLSQRYHVKREPPLLAARRPHDIDRLWYSMS